MNKRIQTYVSEPNENGGFQISRYDTLKNSYFPINGEIFPTEDLSIKHARYLNKKENEEVLIDNYETNIIKLSADFGVWGINEAIGICNELKVRESVLDEQEKQKLVETEKRIIAWNKRVNEMVNIYDGLKSRKIDGLTSPYKYFIRPKPRIA